MKNISICLIPVTLLAVYACTKPTKSPGVITETPTQPGLQQYAGSYTWKIGNIRTWTERSYINTPGVKHDTVTYGNKFQITVLDDTTIYFHKGDTLVLVDSINLISGFYKSDTASQLHYYKRGNDAHDYNILTYYHKRDSIVYHTGFIYQGGSQSTKYYTE